MCWQGSQPAESRRGTCWTIKRRYTTTTSWTRASIEGTWALGAGSKIVQPAGEPGSVSSLRAFAAMSLIESGRADEADLPSVPLHAVWSTALLVWADVCVRLPRCRSGGQPSTSSWRPSPASWRSQASSLTARSPRHSARSPRPWSATRRPRATSRPPRRSRSVSARPCPRPHPRRLGPCAHRRRSARGLRTRTADARAG
jgi:hypothetical protein